MTVLEAIVKDLEHLTPEKMEDAAWFVHVLVEDAVDSKSDILKRTATALSSEDVAEMERTIQTACEDTDEHSW